MNNKVLFNHFSLPSLRHHSCYMWVLILSFSAFFIVGCSFNQEPVAVTLQGQHIESRPKMAKVCKGFYVDDNKILAFFEHSAVAEEHELNPLYQQLPCFSSGTIEINNTQYQWILRAGGVGEFFNDNDRFTKVCGIKCCNKVQGVC